MSKFAQLSNKDVRQFAENIETFASKRGVKVGLEFGGSHPKLTFEKGERNRKYVIPSTPSDNRALLNLGSDIRRMFNTMGWVEEVDTSGATFHNPSQGPASEVKTHAPPRLVTKEKEPEMTMTPPPLSRPDAPNVRGWEVPEVPECAKGPQTKGGKKSGEYAAFADKRARWCDTVRRAGASWEEIVAGLARAGHITNEDAVSQGLYVWKRRNGTLETVRTSAKAKTANIGLNDNLRDQIFSAVEKVIEKRLALATAERDEAIEKMIEMELERDQYKNAFETIQKVMKGV